MTFFFHATIQNSEFYQLFELKYLYENKISNSIFKDCRFGKVTFLANDFVDTTFNDCAFYKNNDFSDNKFINVKLINTEVYSENWLTTLYEENEVDQFTKENHIIEKVIEQNHEYEDEIKYYIRYIGE